MTKKIKEFASEKFLEIESFWCNCLQYKDTTNEKTKVVKFSKSLLALALARKEIAQQIFNEIDEMDGESDEVLAEQYTQIKTRFLKQKEDEKNE